MRPASAVAPALLLLVALLSSSCITRHVKEEVYGQGLTQIHLRSEVRWTTPVEKGFDHPAALAPVRLAHILSRVDVKPPEGWLPRIGKEKERVPAIDAELLPMVSEGLSKALAEADPDQEVVVMAVRETKRWGIFDHDYLTSFVAYVRGEQLYLHFNHFDWEIPNRRDDRLPEPRVGRQPQRFRLYPGEALTLVDTHSVAVDWQHPVFAEATRMRVTPGGEVIRREILLESPPEDAARSAPLGTLPDALSPEQLRALADLEEARREGRITEAEYRAKRRDLLGE